MFNRNNPEEGYLIDDGEVAYNTRTNKKNEKKNDIIDKFELAVIKKDCTKIKIEENGTFRKYVAKFDSRIPMSITINQNYINDNQDIINRLETSKKAKDIVSLRKIKVNLAKVGIILVGGFTLFKIVTPNKEKEDVKIENETNYDDNYMYNIPNNPYQYINFEKDKLENEKNHEQSMEQLYQDNINKEKQTLEKVNDQLKHMELFNKEQNQNMIDQMDEIRNYDELYEHKSY